MVLGVGGVQWGCWVVLDGASGGLCTGELLPWLHGWEQWGSRRWWPVSGLDFHRSCLDKAVSKQWASHVNCLETGWCHIYARQLLLCLLIPHACLLPAWPF